MLVVLWQIRFAGQSKFDFMAELCVRPKTSPGLVKTICFYSRNIAQVQGHVLAWPRKSKAVFWPILKNPWMSRDIIGEY